MQDRVHALAGGSSHGVNGLQHGLVLPERVLQRRFRHRSQQAVHGDELIALALWIADKLDIGFVAVIR